MRTTCRISGKPLTPVIDLGNLYVSAFYRAIEPDSPRSPLQLGIGEDSGLLQLAHTVDPDTLYREYWYRSGTNATMARQLKDVVNVVPAWTRLRDGDVVLDIGCNDGTLLSHYGDVPKLFKVGIDPARNIEEQGRLQCSAHATGYFSSELFLSLSGGRKASVITSIAMFYDLDEPGAFVKDVFDSLADDGVWIAQLSYTPLMLKQNAFDNVIHEHLEFYTLSSMNYLLCQYGFKIVDVELNDVNAGSVRVVVAKDGNPLRHSARFTTDIGDVRRTSLLEYEATLALDNPETYRAFMRRVETQKGALLDLLRQLKGEGKLVYGYGASSKGNTLLQYYGITSEYVTAIAERQPQKWGLLTPGSWIPIVSEDDMRAAKPDYLLVLPWHFIHEFIHREQAFLHGGGRLIVPLPEVRVIEA